MATPRRYLRARAISLGAGTPYLAAAEIRFRATPGGADLTGTGIADSSFSGMPPANAYDGNINTAWANNGTGAGAWLGIDLGVGVTSDCQEVMWRVRNDGAFNQCPTYIKVEGSDDLVTWHLFYEVIPAAWTGAAQVQTWTVPPGPTDLRALQSSRLALTSGSGEARFLQTSRLALIQRGDAKILQTARLTLLALNVSARITQLPRLVLTGSRDARVAQVARLVLRSTAITVDDDDGSLWILW